MWRIWTPRRLIGSVVRAGRLGRRRRPGSTWVGPRNQSWNVATTRTTVASTRASVIAASANVARVGRCEANLSAFIRCSSSQTSRMSRSLKLGPWMPATWDRALLMRSRSSGDGQDLINW